MSEPIQSIKNMDTPAKLWQLRKDIKDSRARLEIMWKLGIAFYRGRQYTYYSSSLKRITQLPVDDLKNRARTRIVSNQIKPNCNKLVAKLMKNKAQFTATSGTGDASDAKAARLAESASDYWWTGLDLSRKERQALTWARVAGQGYWFITWDKYAGDPWSYLCHPDTGEPVPTDIAPHYIEELKSAGINPDTQTKTAYLGDISVQVISPINCWLDNSVEQFEDCRFMGIDFHLSPEEVETRWGVKVSADSVLTDADLGAQTNDLDTAKKAVVIVCGLFIRPCPTLPSGRVVYFTKDKILEDNKTWPFPFKHLPLIKFGSTPIPNSPYDSGETEDAIPLNKELNKTLSQILTHRDLTINPKWKIPRNSVQAFNASDEAIHYTPVNGQTPEMLTHAQLPAYMTEILGDINMRIKGCFGLGDVNTNQAGQPGLESGIALDLAQEESDEVVAPIIEDNEISKGKALQMCLDFAQERYTTERLLEITGDNGMPQIIAFKGSDVKGVSIRCEASSSMPRSKAGRMARVMMMLNTGLIDKDEAYKYLDNPDLKGWKQKRMLDADMADREHQRILQGQPLNPVALQEAQGQVSTGVNPQTQQPFKDPAEVQAFFLQAMLAPTDYEDWQAHYNFHTEYMKTVEFENLDPQKQHEFIQHVSATLTKILDMALASKQREGNVKVSLAAHEVLPPTAVAAVLAEAGVQGIDPAILKEEAPMDSLVIENVTPPADVATGTKPKSPSSKTQRRSAGGV